MVGIVTATDDVGVSGYRFSDSGGTTSLDGFYTIAANGQIRITAAGVAAGIENNDFETGLNSFSYDIEAGDAAGNWSAVESVSLNVTDLDETIPVVTPGQSFNYAENRIPGSVVGTVAASDDIGITGFQIVSGNTDGYFAIDNSGRITLTAAGAAAGIETNDFETGANSFSLGIEARDVVGNWSVAESVTLNLTDLDENDPVMLAGQSLSYAENRLADAVVGAVFASDDIGVSGYRFADSGTSTSLDGFYTIAANGQIRITAAGVAAGLENNDFETGLNSFTYAIEAGDAAGNWSLAENVIFNVTDADESVPVMVPGQSFSYAENQAVGAVVGIVAANDDVGVTGFRFSDSGGSTSLDGFYAVSASGQISLTAAGAAAGAANNDFETGLNSFTYGIEAGDMTGNWSASEIVTLHVTDVDEASPVMDAGQNFSYAENQVAGAVIGIVSASDDVGVTGYRFTDSGNATSLDGFYTIAANGQIRITAAGVAAGNANNDFETGANSFSYDIEAGDAAGNWSVAESVTFDVTDLDETIPVVTVGQSFDYAENRATGTVVGSVIASDDVGVTGYQIASGNTDGYFAIDNAGRITLTVAGAAAGIEANDFEIGNNSFTLGIEARDADGNWSLVENVSLNVLDLDENAPVVNAGQSLSYVENQTAGSVIGIVTATDDAGVTGYRFSDSGASTSLDGYYTIGSIGQVSLTAAGVAAGVENNDFETGSNAFSYGIEARDAAGNWSAAENVTFNVSDVDEAAPVVLGILVADDQLNASETSLVTITFNEAVTGLTNADLTIPNATMTDIATADGGLTWTAILTPSLGGGGGIEVASNVITLADGSVTDLAGLTNVGSTDSNNYAIDTIVPTPSILLDSVIAGDDYVNIAESLGNVLITGTVGNGANDGDTVTLTLVNSNFTGTFTGNVVDVAGTLTFAINVAGYALVNDIDSTIEASISTSDSFGNIGTGTTSEGYVVDIVAPVPLITLDDKITPDDIISSVEIGTDIAVTGTVDGDVQAGDVVTLTVNNKTFTDLVQGTPGAYTFSVDVPGADLAADDDRVVEASITVYDLAGNPGTDTDTEGYLVDTGPPPKPVINAISEDTAGASNSDGITSDQTLIFYGTAEANTIVEVFIGGASIGTTTVDGVGLWNFNYESTVLPSGSYVITATATDLAGNTSDVSNDFFLTIDTSVPTKPVITAISDDTAGASASDGITSDQGLIFYGKADVGTTVEVFIGLTSIGTTTVNGTGDWTFDHNGSPLANGSYVVTAKATNVAGSVSDASDNFTVVVDTVAPTVTIIGAITDDTGTNTADLLTYDQELVLTGTVADANGVEKVQIYDDNGFTLLGEATVIGGSWNYTTAALTEGDHSFTAKATDIAGNSASTAALNVTVDLTAPAVTINGAIADDTGTNITDLLTYDQTLVLTGTVSDANGIDKVQIYDNGSGTPLGDATVISGNWSFTTPLLAEGDHSLTVTAIDAAGLSTTTAALDVEVDITGPTVASITMSDWDLIIGETSTLEIKFSEEVTGFDNLDVSVENGSIDTLATADGGLTWTALFTPLEDIDEPVNVVTVGAGYEDLAGNAGTGLVSSNYTIDTTDPGFVCTLYTSPALKVTSPVPHAPPVGSTDLNSGRAGHTRNYLWRCAGQQYRQ